MLPASELAMRCRLTPQTTSFHLARLVEGGLLKVERHGRHRYYQLASREAGQAIEALQAISPQLQVRSLKQSEEARVLRFARTCYDHLAGRVGVAITEGLLTRGYLVEEDTRHYQLTAQGEAWFAHMGIRSEDERKKRRIFAAQCLDWSERKYHLAGALGASLANQLLTRNWLTRLPGGRALRLTEEGRLQLSHELGLQL